MKKTKKNFNKRKLFGELHEGEFLDSERTFLRSVLAEIGVDINNICFIFKGGAWS